MEVGREKRQEVKELVIRVLRGLSEVNVQKVR